MNGSVKVVAYVPDMSSSAWKDVKPGRIAKSGPLAMNAPLLKRHVLPKPLVFDPLAVSMRPVKGWRVGDLFIPGAALVAAKSDMDRAA